MTHSHVTRSFVKLVAAAAMVVLADTVIVQAQDADIREVNLAIEDRALVSELETSGGLPVLRVRQGERVTLRWTADERTELHLHGYDIDLALERDEPDIISFEATVAGRFALEAHGLRGADDRGDADRGEEVHGHGDEQASEADEDEVILLYVEVLPR